MKGQVDENLWKQRSDIMFDDEYHLYDMLSKELHYELN